MMFPFGIVYRGEVLLDSVGLMEGRPVYAQEASKP